MIRIYDSHFLFTFKLIALAVQCVLVLLLEIVDLVIVVLMQTLNLLHLLVLEVAESVLPSSNLIISSLHLIL